MSGQLVDPTNLVIGREAHSIGGVEHLVSECPGGDRWPCKGHGPADQGQRVTVTDGVTTVLAHSVAGYRLTAEDENTIMAAMTEAASDWKGASGWQGVPALEALGWHSIGCSHDDLRFPELCWINLKAQLLLLGGYEHPWVDRAECERREGADHSGSDYAVGPVAG